MSTSEPHPLYSALRGTLVSKVNFTGWRYPCQKYLRGRLRNLVKFTFRGDPRQKGFWGTLPFEVNFTGWRSPRQKALEGSQGVAFRVERVRIVNCGRRL